MFGKQIKQLILTLESIVEKFRPISFFEKLLGEFPQRVQKLVPIVDIGTLPDEFKLRIVLILTAAVIIGIRAKNELECKHIANYLLPTRRRLLEFIVEFRYRFQVVQIVRYF